ncbi:MAG: sigma 54-interacting transcriptional regulator [Myxococcota bacterium]
MTDAGSTLRHEIPALPLRALRISVVRGPDQGKVHTAASDTVAIGTAPDNDLVLSDQTVSRYHLELRHAGDRILARDLGSTNGTISGKVLLERAALLPGVNLRLGNTQVVVDDGEHIALPLYESDELAGVRGRSQPMRRLMAQIAKVSRSDVSVALLGETGVGKEVIASAIHRASARAAQPFETVDCGALAPTLIASELFGHEKGAFTGAEKRHLGAFERAHGGTLFLDEIGELPLALQTTLLGALERRTFRRLGGDKAIAVDVRLVSATNRDLRAEVNAGKFREDLYYRTAVVRMEIPPLRERVEDIPLLIEHFLGQAGLSGPIGDVFPPEALDMMAEYRWPGNVRELRNFVEAAIAMGEVPELERSRAAAAAPAQTLEPRSGLVFPSVPVESLLEETYKSARSLVLDEFERLYLARLLERSKDNVSSAARTADIHRTYLNEMLKRHGLR